MNNVIPLHSTQDVRSFRLLRKSVWEILLTDKTRLQKKADLIGSSTEALKVFIQDKIKEIDISLMENLPISTEEFQLMHDTGYDITGTNQ